MFLKYSDIKALYKYQIFAIGKDYGLENFSSKKIQ